VTTGCSSPWFDHDGNYQVSIFNGPTYKWQIEVCQLDHGHEAQVTLSKLSANDSRATTFGG